MIHLHELFFWNLLWGTLQLFISVEYFGILLWANVDRF